jgi:glycosyltransferase involved in cell wall biosynthesis
MGLDVLLDAWAEVVQQQPGAVLVVVGEGPERRVLEQRARALELGDRVRFAGEIGERSLVDHYQAATCTVVPSRSLEGFGLVVLESLACGTPAVVTNVGGLPEAIADLDRSLVLRPNDPDALQRRLLAVAAGDVPTADACRVHAERFSWKAVAHRHLELYSSLAT